MNRFRRTGSATTLLLIILTVFMMPPASGDTFETDLGQGRQAVVSFQPPAGWEQTQHSSEIIYYLPSYHAGEQCLLSLSLPQYYPGGDVSHSMYSDALWTRLVGQPRGPGRSGGTDVERHQCQCDNVVLPRVRGATGWPSRDIGAVRSQPVGDSSGRCLPMSRSGCEQAAMDRGKQCAQQL